MSFGLRCYQWDVPSSNNPFCLFCFSGPPGAPSGEYVVLQYHAVAGPGFVTETVVLQRDGTRGLRAAGYFVKPE